MSIYSRACLRSFLVAFLAIWVGLQAVLWLTLLAAFLKEHPYVPLGLLGQVLPDLMVQALPLSLCFAVLLGAVLSTSWISRRQGYLWMEMAGGGAWRRQGPLLAVGLVLSAFLGWLFAGAFPVASYRIGHVTPTSADTAGTLALRFAEHPGTLGGFRVSLGGIADDTMRDVTVVSRRRSGRMVLTAAQGRAQVTPGGEELALEFSEGRLLRFDEAGGLQLNSCFDHLELRHDARRIAGRSKRGLLSLNHYTNEELERIPAQHEELVRKGWRVRPRDARRVAVVDAARWFRVQGAVLPFLLLLLGMVFLARHIPARRPVLAVGVVFTGALLLLQYAVQDVGTYKHGQAVPAWVIFLPTLEVLALCAVRVAWVPLGRLLHHAD